MTVLHTINYAAYYLSTLAALAFNFYYLARRVLHLEQRGFHLLMFWMFLVALLISFIVYTLELFSLSKIAV
jgi:hypothetical protein